MARIPVKVKKIIDQTVSLIRKEAKNNVKAILLFGSYAGGTAIWRSDIDICVVFKKNLSLREATLFRIRVLGNVPDIVDLQVFNVLPLKVKKSIVENHTILFQSKEFREDSFVTSNRSLFFELKRRVASMGA